MTLRSGASLVVAGVLIAGCGGGGKPEDVAVSYVGSNAAGKCALLTQALVEQLTHQKGAAARATCRRNVVRFPAPKHVLVRRVQGGGEEHDADSGESDVELVADGHAAEVKLVKQHERWQIAALGD